MKTWDQFLRDVLPDVTGCPEPVAEHAIMRAAQEFCMGSRAWRVWLDPVTTRENVTEYDIELEPSTILARLENATLDGRIIDVLAQEDLRPDWKTNSNGLSTCVFTQDGQTVTLLPAQTAGMSLLIEASLQPTDDAQGVPDFIHQQYAEIIAMGAKARLMRQANKPYTDFAQSLSLRSDFEGLTNSAGIRRMRGMTSTRSRPRLKTF